MHGCFGYLKSKDLPVVLPSTINKEFIRSKIFVTIFLFFVFEIKWRKTLNVFWNLRWGENQVSRMRVLIGNAVETVSFNWILRNWFRWTVNTLVNCLIVICVFSIHTTEERKNGILLNEYHFWVDSFIKLYNLSDSLQIYYFLRVECIFLWKIMNKKKQLNCEGKNHSSAYGLPPCSRN